MKLTLTIEKSKETTFPLQMLSQLDFVRINECFKEPCLNDGQCVPLDNGFVCHCLPGFWGKDTEKRHIKLRGFCRLRGFFPFCVNDEYRSSEFARRQQICTFGTFLKLTFLCRFYGYVSRFKILKKLSASQRFRMFKNKSAVTYIYLIFSLSVECSFFCYISYYLHTIILLFCLV